MIVKPYLQKLAQLYKLWLGTKKTGDMPIRDGLKIKFAEGGLIFIYGAVRGIRINPDSREIVSFAQAVPDVHVMLVADWNVNYIPMEGEDFLKKTLSDVITALQGLLVDPHIGPNWEELHTAF